MNRALDGTVLRELVEAGCIGWLRGTGPNLLNAMLAARSGNR